MKVFVVFVCDQHLTKSSMEMIGVCSTKENAVKLCDIDASNNTNSLTEEEKGMLLDALQTQGRNENYIVYPMGVDEELE